MNNELLNDVKRLKAIANVGLLYSNNEYDKERYAELHEISLALLSKISGQQVETLKAALPAAKDYPTPKVDVRGLVLSADKKILLVRESADNKWSLPGGWADVGYSAKEVIIKEFKEETGLDVVPESLLAVFDKKMHPHPPQPFYVYKLVFYCKPLSTELMKGFDVSGVSYFDIDNLPELSEDRILKGQIELIYKKILDDDRTVYFD